MTLADNVEFRNRLVALAEVFDVKLSPARQALYFEALRDVPFEAVARSLNEAVKTSKFFPRPAELRELALGNADDRIEAAWLAMREAMRQVGAYASIATADPVLGESIRALFGGWPEACVAEFSPEMWTAKRKEFGRIYRAIAGRSLVGARYLPGVTEQRNSGQLEWEKYTTVAVLEGPSRRLLNGEEAHAYRAQVSAQASGFQQLAAGEDAPERARDSA